MYPEKALRKHPFANPNRGRFGKKGYPRGRYETTDGYGNRITRVSVMDASRWLPHQGEQEIARRLRQAEGRANG